MSELALPPQPTPAAFMKGEIFLEAAYKAALAAWREVCRELVEAQKSREFFR